MSDYEPYVSDPAEAPPRERLARMRPTLAWLAGIVLVLALAFTWVQSTGTEDPSLSVPADQLITEPPAGDEPAADPAAPPADAGAPVTDEPPAG